MVGTSEEGVWTGDQDFGESGPWLSVPDPLEEDDRICTRRQHKETRENMPGPGKVKGETRWLSGHSV